MNINGDRKQIYIEINESACMYVREMERYRRKTDGLRKPLRVLYRNTAMSQGESETFIE